MFIIKYLRRVSQQETRSIASDDTTKVIVIEPDRGPRFEDHLARVEHLVIRIVALASLLVVAIEIIRNEIVRLFQ